MAHEGLAHEHDVGVVPGQREQPLVRGGAEPAGTAVQGGRTVGGGDELRERSGDVRLDVSNVYKIFADDPKPALAGAADLVLGSGEMAWVADVVMRLAREA